MTSSDRKKIFQHIARQRKLQESRKEYLYHELKTKYNVMAREDSRLCRKYIFGEDIDISSIAYMIRETDWFHKNTPYHATNQSLQAAHKEHCAKDIDPFIIKDLFSSLAKVICNDIDQEKQRCNNNSCILFGIRPLNKGIDQETEAQLQLQNLQTLPTPITI